MIRKCFIILLFVLALSSTSDATERILSHESVVLSKCFESILECEAGYVFYGKKPLCILEYYQNCFYFEPREYHRKSVACCVAKNILKRSLFRSGNIIFHFDEKGDTLLIINRQKFLSTVKENLVLFQYVLGPTITPERLLEAITSPDRSFNETLHYDRVLIGIVLGYGVQNSLFQSRYENILCDLVVAEDVPPFMPNITHFPTESSKEDLIFFEKNPRNLWEKNRSFLNATYGFSCLEEEIEEIEKKMTVSSETLQKKPYFIFGCLKATKENEIFLADLEETQEKIETLLQSQSLVKDVLALICEDDIEIEENKNEIFFQTQKVDLNVTLAKLLRSGLSEYHKKYINYFIEGLKGQVDDSELAGNILASPNAVTNMQNAKHNLEEANYFFSKLKSDNSFTKILEPYLYYSVLSEGEGSSLKGQPEVLVDYEICDPSGKSLNGELQKRLDLKKTISAFAHGLQGMKIGEKRLLFIHPSLAYGVHTFLKKGVYLKAIVTLHNICEAEHDLPLLDPIDLSFVLEDEFQQRCEEEHKRLLRFMGAQRREFLKSCPGINIDLIAKAFQSMDSGSSLTQEESDAINQFFWRVYFHVATDGKHSLHLICL
jgi:hypothetical protein